MPLSTTKTDFWCLVEEHDVNIIVMMNTLSEAQVKKELFNVYLIKKNSLFVIRFNANVRLSCVYTFLQTDY